MLNKIYEFTLDLENNTYIPSMEFYKNDTDTSRIEITLKNDYQTLNLEGFTIVCKILKADDLELQNIVDIVDKDNGLIAINLSSQALASIGTNTVQLSIYEGLKRLSSKEFAYTVKDTLTDEEGIVSQNEYTLLTQLISSVQNVEDIINSSEVTRVFNESTRIDNEATREVQEQDRQVLKGQMDSLKIALDSLKTSMEALKVDVETSESTRELNETDRELLKASMETLKSTLEALEVSLSTNETNRGLTFNSKIDAIDNKIIDVEARSVAKENLIDNKIVEVENRTLVKEALVDNKIVEANATIANVNIAKTNTETVTANANAKISETETTRQSIIATINNLVAQFNALAPASSTNAEVQLARTDITGKTHASLQERLLADNKQQNILYSSVSGTYITSDSVDGYAKNVVIEGNTYQNPALLSEIKSVGTKLADGRYEIPLLCTNKNINNSEFELGGFNWSTGEPSVASDRYRSKYFISVNKNADIVSNFSSQSIKGIVEYDVDKKFVKSSANAYKITTSSNTRYVKLLIGDPSNIQLEYGTVSSSYEIPQSNKLTILSDYQIEKVGTVADRIIQASDKVWDTEKNIGTIVLDGSQTILATTTSNGYGRFRLDIPGGAVFTELMATMFSSIFNSTEWATPTKNQIHYGNALTSSLGGIAIVINGILTATDLNNYLKTSPITIKYKLATPIYIPLPDDQQIALRTFNNKTNILSLCEIEPTIKADVPKSLGASVNSINAHLDVVDSELEKIKRLEDATNSTVVTDKDFVNIGETGNGYLSDVKLEGRTLVNLRSNGKFSNPAVIGKSYLYDVNIQEGKTYTAIFRKSSICKNAIYNFNTSSFIQNYSYDNIFKFTVPVGSDIRFYVETYSGDVSTQNTVALPIDWKDIIILEGDYTQSLPNGYFAGLKSVGQDATKIVVSSVNASGNLFDGELELGTLNTDGSLGVITDRTVNKNYVRVIGGRAFYLSNSLNYTVWRIAVYDKDKKFIQIVTNGTIIPSNAVYCKFCLLGASLTNNVQLEVGTIATSYKTIETDKKEILYLDTVDSTWKKPTFRGIWNNGVLTVGDVAEKKSDGKYSYRKRMGEDLFNSNIGWELSNTRTNTIVFVFNNAKYKLNGACICDKLETKTAIDLVNTDIEGIALSTSLNRIIIALSKTKATDLATLGTYLTSNPMTVVSSLATEQIYECTPLDLSSYSTETNYYFESGVLSPRSTIKVQNYIGEIINNLKEQVSVLQNKVYTDNMLLKAMLLNHETRLVLGGH